jgi:hypothetical protein
MVSMLLDRARQRVKDLALINQRIAIHACLEMIFDETVAARPKIIVDLGVSKEALANKVLVAAAELFHARIASCDLADFSKVCKYPRWSFFQADASHFGEQYAKLLKDEGNVDVLLVDCDEKYNTTIEILNAWLPNMSPACTILMRCTNLNKILRYVDGTSTTLGWDNERGVIRAINHVLGVEFDETKPHRSEQKGWVIHHIPWGGGLTSLRREAA